MSKRSDTETACGKTPPPSGRQRTGGNTNRANRVRTARSRIEDLAEKRRLQEELGDLWED